MLQTGTSCSPVAPGSVQHSSEISAGALQLGHSSTLAFVSGALPRADFSLPLT